MHQYQYNLQLIRIADQLANIATDARISRIEDNLRKNIFVKKADEEWDWKNISGSLTGMWNKGVNKVNEVLKNQIIEPVIGKYSDDILKHINWSLAGAGIGAGLGLGSQLLAPKRKRDYLSSLLHGGLLGGVAGLAGSAIHSVYPSVNEALNRPDDKAILAAKEKALAEAKNYEQSGFLTPQLLDVGNKWGIPVGELSRFGESVYYHGQNQLNPSLGLPYKENKPYQDFINRAKSFGDEPLSFRYNIKPLEERKNAFDGKFLQFLKSQNRAANLLAPFGFGNSYEELARINPRDNASINKFIAKVLKAYHDPENKDYLRQMYLKNKPNEIIYKTWTESELKKQLPELINWANKYHDMFYFTDPGDDVDKQKFVTMILNEIYQDLYNSGTITPLDRALHNIPFLSKDVQRRALAQLKNFEPINALNTFSGNFGGISNLFGTGGRSSGLLKDLDRALTANIRITPEMIEKSTTMKRLMANGISPAELLYAWRQGDAGIDRFIEEQLKFNKKDQFQNLWTIDRLKNFIDENIDNLRQESGATSIISNPPLFGNLGLEKNPYTWGNTAADVLTTTVAADAGLSIFNKILKNRMFAGYDAAALFDTFRKNKLPNGAPLTAESLGLAQNEFNYLKQMYADFGNKSFSGNIFSHLYNKPMAGIEGMTKKSPGFFNWDAITNTRGLNIAPGHYSAGLGEINKAHFLETVSDIKDKLHLSNLINNPHETLRKIKDIILFTQQSNLTTENLKLLNDYLDNILGKSPEEAKTILQDILKDGFKFTPNGVSPAFLNQYNNNLKTLLTDTLNLNSDKVNKILSDSTMKQQLNALFKAVQENINNPGSTSSFNLSINNKSPNRSFSSSPFLLEKPTNSSPKIEKITLSSQHMKMLEENLDKFKPVNLSADSLMNFLKDFKTADPKALQTELIKAIRQGHFNSAAPGLSSLPDDKLIPIIKEIFDDAHKEFKVNYPLFDLTVDKLRQASQKINQAGFKPGLLNRFGGMSRGASRLAVHLVPLILADILINQAAERPHNQIEKLMSIPINPNAGN